MPRSRPSTNALSASARYPWALIELDYKAGVIPIPGLLHKYAPLTRERLLTVARQHGWERRTLTAEDVYGPRTFGMLPSAPGAIPTSPDEVRAFAIAQASQVVDVHRRDIAKTRALFETLMSRALLAMAGHRETMIDPNTGEPIYEEDGETPVYLPLTGARETPSDVLNKLSAALVRVIGLERQAYGMDVLGINDPDAPESGDAEKSAMAELEERLDRIAAAKAHPVRVPDKTTPPVVASTDDGRSVETKPHS